MVLRFVLGIAAAASVVTMIAVIAVTMIAVIAVTILGLGFVDEAELTPALSIVEDVLAG